MGLSPANTIGLILILLILSCILIPYGIWYWVVQQKIAIIRYNRAVRRAADLEAQQAARKARRDGRYAAVRDSQAGQDSKRGRDGRAQVLRTASATTSTMAASGARSTNNSSTATGPDSAGGANNASNGSGSNVPPERTAVV